MATLPPLSVSDEDRAALCRWVRAGSTEQRLAQRARIVLAAADGQPSRRIAAREGVSAPTVARWRKRYARSGLHGLRDRPRPGRPRRYGCDDRLAIVALLATEPPPGATHWTLAAIEQALAETVGISDTQIYKILCELDLRPWQQQAWLTSRDPDVWQRTAVIGGLYLGDAHHALVLSVDDLTSDDADAPPTVPAREHATADLFAAVTTHADQIARRAARGGRDVTFDEFLVRLDGVTPRRKVLHVVADDASGVRLATTRVRQANDDGRRRLVIHDTATASWLNQVELWCEMLSPRDDDQRISTEELMTALRTIVNDQDRAGPPLVWMRDRSPARPAGGDRDGASGPPVALAAVGGGAQ